MIGIQAGHPLTEDRRALMRREDRAATGPEILSAGEWQALKTICRSEAREIARRRLRLDEDRIRVHEKGHARSRH